MTSSENSNSTSVSQPPRPPSWAVASAISATVRVRGPDGLRHRRGGLGPEVRRIVEELQGEPEHPAAHQVQRMMRHLEGEAALAEDADDGVEVPDDGRPRFRQVLD